MEDLEKGTTRQHTFFCTDKERHITNEKVLELKPKEIEVLGQKVQGWLVTTEVQVIDKIIPLRESMQEEVIQHDPE